MNSVISYSLYKKKKHNIRKHDLLKNDDNRYWYNIPMIIICNSNFFKDSISRFYVHKNMTNTSMFSFLNKISKLLYNVEIQILEDNYKNSRPMLWRLKPLWDDNIKFCFCRDIDSLVEQKKFKVLDFLKNMITCIFIL